MNHDAARIALTISFGNGGRLTPEDLLLILCVHGGKHVWECLKWLVDVRELVDRFPQLDYDALIQRAGRWDDSTMTSAYLSRLPIKFLRRMAGFFANGGSYFVARSSCEPPLS